MYITLKALLPISQFELGLGIISVYSINLVYKQPHQTYFISDVYITEMFVFGWTL